MPALDYAAEGNFGGISLAWGVAGEEVPIVALDSLALSAVDVVKVDVEGMEAEVLSGARALLARHRPVLYLENDRREKSPALIKLLDELGYECWWHTPPLFNPANFAGNPHNVFPGIISINLLCLPREGNTVLRGFRKLSGPADWILTS